MTIKTRFILIFSILTLLISSVTILVIMQSDEGALAINLAGRQRMLSQRMSKGAFMIADVNNRTTDPNTPLKEKITKELQTSMTLFDNTLNALHHGGATLDGANQSVTLTGISNAEAAQVMEEIQTLWSNFKNKLNYLIEATNTDDPQYQEALSFIRDKNGALLKKSNEVVGLLQKDSEKQAQLMKNIMISLSIIVICIAVYGFWFSYRLSSRLQQLAKLREDTQNVFSYLDNIVSHIADGDLTVTTKQLSWDQHTILLDKSSDEVGQLQATFGVIVESINSLNGLFDRMISNLSEMVLRLRDNSRELVSAATEITSSAEQMARGSQQQSNQVNQVSAAIEEMAASIVASSRNAADATDAAKGASDTAMSGGQVVNETIQGMQRIADVVRDSANSISKLASSADQIGEIISVIDDIADQTNLLALNAAIEAARAGEQGRGFAVVADEVRKLAERTGKATGEITDMIKGIQRETEEAVHSMEAGIKEVDLGREHADKAGNSLNEIVAMNQRVVDMIQQIAAAAEEQSIAAEEVSRNVEGISTVSQETAYGAEQSAAAAEQLNRQAENLQSMVARFKIPT